MGGKDLDSYFEGFLQQKSIFKGKKTLQTNHTPQNISHREKEIQDIAKILAPALKGEKASNLFLYGKTGTGKTLTTIHVTQTLKKVAKEKNIPLEIIYINCKLKRTADTEYRLVAELCRKLGKTVPPTGLPTEEIYKTFFSGLRQSKHNIILILDEIDQLLKKAGDGILYSLTRLHDEVKDNEVSLVGISNSLTFVDGIDPRVRSSLSEEEIIFPPYNAFQLQDILRQRTKDAFIQGAIDNGVIEKCAAYAAREHGDARRALQLLRVAAELAERKGETKVQTQHVDEAEDKIDTDRAIEIVQTQPSHHQAVLLSIFSLTPLRQANIFTGEVYSLYKSYCDKLGTKPLTQRRISDIIAEFDMLGLINAKVISKGRYGRTREISLSLPKHLTQELHTTLQQKLNLR